MIQTDAALNREFRAGPSSPRGEVVGINNAIIGMAQASAFRSRRDRRDFVAARLIAPGGCGAVISGSQARTLSMPRRVAALQDDRARDRRAASNRTDPSGRLRGRH